MMGRWRAVKVVFRDSFKEERPFNREFSGIRRFEPISRSHEGFVDVLHVGMNADLGCFYYVMEIGDDRVSGQAIVPESYSPDTLSAEIAKRGRLPLAECLRLSIQLSHALSELHKHGLVHRDVKPSNIIFVDGVPKLADIGLVADMDETRSFVGTEGFIPPEGPGTPQADVYSLGKLLYEASTGKDRLDFPELPVDWSQSAEYTGLLELNEVILRACHHDPAKRYASAWNMHADLLLVLNGKSVKRLRMLERRMQNVKRTAGIGLLVLTLVGAVSYQVYREWRTADEAHRRQVSDNVAYGNRAMDSGDYLGALPYFAEALRLEERDPKDELSERLRFSATLAQCPKPVQVWQAPTAVHWGQFSPDGRRILLAGYLGKAEVHDLETGRLLSAPFGPNYGLRSADYSPDGRFIVTASEDHSVIIWNADSLSHVRDLPHSNMVFSARYSPDGRQIVTACLDGYAYVWDAATGERRFALGPYTGDVWTGVSFADFSRDGTRIVVTSYNGETDVWQAADGRPLPLRFPHNEWVVYANFSPDGERLVVASTDHKARVWDLTTGRRVYPDLKHDDAVRSAEYSPDGRFILTAAFDGTARLWRAQDLQPVASDAILRHGERVAYACFGHDGRLVLTACTDGSVRIWDLANSLLPPQPRLGSLCGNASRFLTCTNGQLRVWETLTGKAASRSILPHGLLERAELNPDGSHVLSVSTVTVGLSHTNYVVQVWEVASGKEVGREIRLTNALTGAALSTATERVATWAGPVAQIWDVTNGEPLTPLLSHSEDVQSALFSPRGDLLVTVSGGDVLAWDAANGRQIYPPLSHPAPVKYVAFNRDGRYLVTCCADSGVTKRSAQVWDAATGRPMSPPLKHADGVLFAAFSPDNKRIVTASEDFTARVWDIATGKPVGLPLKHGDQVAAARFSADGRWLATVCKDGTVRVWDPENNTPLTPPLGHCSGLLDVRFLPNDRGLAVIGKKNRVFMWDLSVQTRPATDLAQLADFLSGGGVTLSTGMTEEPSMSLLTRWQELRRTFPEDLASSEQNILRWHECQVEESQAEGDWFAVCFHLRCLLKLRPDDQSLSERLAKASEHLSR